jgi:putative transcriptional regulator
MSKLGKLLIAAAKEGVEIARGEAPPESYRLHVPAEIDVKAMRKKSGMTQKAFAVRYGLTLARVQDWEQGRSFPEGPIRAYLRVIEREPEAVERALKIDHRTSKKILRYAELEKRAQEYRERAKRAGSTARMLRATRLEAAAHNKVLALGGVTSFRSGE